jgi:hypothetical protein
MSPNHDSTKVCFAYFGFYSGAVPDKRKHEFLIIRAGRKRASRNRSITCPSKKLHHSLNSPLCSCWRVQARLKIHEARRPVAQQAKMPVLCAPALAGTIAYTTRGRPGGRASLLIQRVIGLEVVTRCQGRMSSRTRLAEAWRITKAGPQPVLV